jgi:hypothetical protein
VDRGVILPLPPPGVPAPGEPWEVCPAAPLVGGEPVEGARRGVDHGLGGEALMRAAAGSERLRNGAGHQDVRPRERCVEVVLEPLRGCMLLALGTGAVATGMVPAVWSPTGWALRQAVAVVSAVAVWDGPEDLAVGEGQMGGALQGLWRNGGAELAEGGPGRSPGRRAWRRSEASAWPV